MQTTGTAGGYDSIMKLLHKMKTTDMNYTPIQLKLPVDMVRIIKISDPVYSFSEVMAHIDLHRYFVEKEHETGRPRCDRDKLLKIVLFAFMEFGYCSVCFIQKLCEIDIRFIWMLDEDNAPSHMTISNFIHKELSGSLEDTFNDINRYMFGQHSVDLNHAYIDGTFGGIKWNKGYKWLCRRGIEGVLLELGLISCGFNLYKYHLKKMAMQRAA